jgi:hypothetical protein
LCVGLDREYRRDANRASPDGAAKATAAGRRTGGQSRVCADGCSLASRPSVINLFAGFAGIEVRIIERVVFSVSLLRGYFPIASDD